MLNIFIVLSPLHTPEYVCMYIYRCTYKYGSCIYYTIAPNFPLTLKPQFTSLFLWTWLLLNTLFNQNQNLSVFFMLAIFAHHTIKTHLLASYEAYTSFMGEIVFYCVHVPYYPSPGIPWWTHKLFSTLYCCKQCTNISLFSCFNQFGYTLKMNFSFFLLHIYLYI